MWSTRQRLSTYPNRDHGQLRQHPKHMALWNRSGIEELDLYKYNCQIKEPSLMVECRSVPLQSSWRTRNWEGKSQCVSECHLPPYKQPAVLCHFAIKLWQHSLASRSKVLPISSSMSVRLPPRCVSPLFLILVQRIRLKTCSFMVSKGSLRYLDSFMDYHDPIHAACATTSMVDIEITKTCI